MSTTAIDKTHCKTCLHVLDAHTAIKDGCTPTEDSISVCAYCGMISVFDKDLNLREMTAEEMDSLQSEFPTVMKMLREVQLVIKKEIDNN